MDAIGDELRSSVADMPDQTDRFATVYKVLGNAIAARAFPGCAFGVLAGGEVVLADALGRFTYEEELSCRRAAHCL